MPKKKSQIEPPPGPGRRPFERLGRMALVAHQLTTPLVTISTLSQGLMRRAEKLSAEDIRARAERIWLASQQLQDLIGTILSYTRANVGALNPNRRRFNLGALVRRACREQQRLAPERKFDIAIENLPRDYIGDPALLEQVLAIMLSNALKYSRSDTPVTIEARENDAIVIIVRDQGIGIPQKDIPFLTVPFFRARNAMQVSGTGLGLSLAWHILELHGGTLAIESRKGHGTSVTITLPKEQASRSGTT